MAVLKYLDGGVYHALPIGDNVSAVQPDAYSTDETIIGSWTNGKPIYRYTVVTTTPTPTSDGTYISSTIDYDKDVEEVIKINTSLKNNMGTNNITYCTLPYTTNTGYNIKANYSITDKLFNIVNGIVDFGGETLTITLEYTKTTDAENSFDISMISTIDLDSTATNDEVAACF